jgi:hypothetical protein
VNDPRAALSILKVIGQATSLLRLRRKAFLLSERRTRVVQPSAQLDFTEKKARKRNWSDRILRSARILGIQRGNVYRPTIGRDGITSDNHNRPHWCARGFICDQWCISGEPRYVAALGLCGRSSLAAEYSTVDGIVETTKRQVYVPDAHKQKIPELLMAPVDILDITFSADSDADETAARRLVSAKTDFQNTGSAFSSTSSLLKFVVVPWVYYGVLNWSVQYPCNPVRFPCIIVN